MKRCLSLVFAQSGVSWDLPRLMGVLARTHWPGWQVGQAGKRPSSSYHNSDDYDQCHYSHWDSYYVCCYSPIAVSTTTIVATTLTTSIITLALIVIVTFTGTASSIAVTTIVTRFLNSAVLSCRIHSMV